MFTAFNRLKQERFTLSTDFPVSRERRFNVGEQAAAVKIAGGASPLVPAPWATHAATALSAFGNAVEEAVTPPPTSLAQALTAIIAIGSAGQTLASAISALPPAATTIVTAT